MSARGDTPPRAARMRAGIIFDAGRLEVREVPRPTPAPGQLLIRIEGCGVCASSVPLWEGRPWFGYPTDAGAPGHEAWGRVAGVGAGVRGFVEGDRVAALTYHGHAEFDLANADDAIGLPASLDDRAVPGEPLGCAMNIFERSDIRAGQTVAIVGIGFLGALLTQLAVRAGARVLAITRRPFAQALATRLGASESMGLDAAEDPVARVRETTGGAGCERVIEAVGLQHPLDVAAQLTAERGRLVIAGYHQDGPRQVDMQQWNWRGIDVINAHERAPARYLDGIRRAIAAMADGRLDPSPLLTHRFPLESLGTALDMTRERPDGFVKAVVEP
ncbi:MAG: zinc-binding dehydrogenase [Lautropia sp.]